MSDQNPFGPPPAQPYGAPPPPQPPAYGAVPPQGQPGYPAPGAYPGYPGYPGYPTQPPKKSRRTLWILIGCFLGLLVLIGGLLAYFVYDVTSKAGTKKIALPTEFKSMARDDSSEAAKQLSDGIVKEIGSGDGSWSPTGVSALYKSADESQAVIVVGAYGKVLQPQRELDGFFKGISESDGATVSGRRSVDPGPLGGKLDCATVSNGESEFGVCAWADSSSVIGVVEANEDGKAPSLDKVATDARDLRQVAEVPK
ncbi:hypothetical protein [Kitasatospora sp. NPDC050543]|uniref:hypothetical protein n=1 Tax=Kitasatospora sp. NPDC050543 TaxID=3364054 RepID=UPI0037A3E7FC